MIVVKWCYSWYIYVFKASFKLCKLEATTIKITEVTRKYVPRILYNTFIRNLIYLPLAYVRYAEAQPNGATNWF